MTEFGRRTVLNGMGAPGIAGTAEAEPFFTRIGMPIGLQLYALGDEIRADLGAAFASVAAMGYGEVELPSLLGSSAAELKRLADAAGVKIASLHVLAQPFTPADTLTFEAQPDAIAQVAQALGVHDLVIPFPLLPADFALGAGEDYPAAINRAFAAVGLDHWRGCAERFNIIGTEMQRHGLNLSYHNHNLEFAPVEGTTAFELLMQETGPELVKVQLDVGWVVTAGHDPVTILQALAGRVQSLHVKDVAADNQQGYYFGSSSTDVGSGTIDWTQVLPAAVAAGAEHYFVEQEAPFAIPRAEAAARSAAYLKTLVA